MNPILETALRLGKRGLRVAFSHAPIPGGCTCGSEHVDSPNSIGKHPIGKTWQRRATSDEQQINDAYLDITHNCNLGLVLGPCDAGYIIAIDVDDEESFATLQTKFGLLPETLTGRSPRGARMFYRVADDDAKELKNVTGVDGKPGVDCKVKGGFVVVGPSMHANGKAYTWDNLDTPIADLPIAWLQSILPKPKPKPVAYTPGTPDTKEVNRVRRWAQAIARREAERVSQAPEGQRNAVLYQAACRTFPAVFEAGLSSFDARTELTAGAKAAGLGDKEIHLTLTSAEEWVVKNDVRRKIPEPTGHLHIVEGGAAVESYPAREPSELIYDRGAPAKIAANVYRIFNKYHRKIKYNEFTDHVTWDNGDALKPSDIVEVQGWLYEQPESSRIRTSVETIQLALVRYSEDHAYHPVREYLRSLTWDKESRVDRLFTRAFGAPDTNYIRAVSKCFMIGAVARVMRPGCKHDTMPVLEGAPGLLKSTALRTLAGDDWFSDTPLTPGDKDAYQNLIGVWIYEHAELDSFSRARDVERIMAYLSSSKDHYRKSYGHRAEDVPRQSVFAGTTNKNEYLGDGTNGLNRRMWPVPCTAIDVSLIRDHRDQLWAEAVALFDAHERWWLPNEVKAAHAELAENRNSPDPWLERIAMLEPREHTMGDVLMHCGVDQGKRTVFDEKRLAPLLRQAGWHPHRVKRNGVTIRFWVPTSFAAAT
jgi:hypothetical protein